jgi:hypothetical protein
MSKPKEDPVFYQLSRDIFLKTTGSEYLNDKSRKYYIDKVKNAKRLAELFLEEFENNDDTHLK